MVLIFFLTDLAQKLPMLISPTHLLWGRAFFINKIYICLLDYWSPQQFNSFFCVNRIENTPENWWNLTFRYSWRIGEWCMDSGSFSPKSRWQLSSWTTLQMIIAFGPDSKNQSLQTTLPRQRIKSVTFMSYKNEFQSRPITCEALIDN